MLTEEEQRQENLKKYLESDSEGDQDAKKVNKNDLNRRKNKKKKTSSDSDDDQTGVYDQRNADLQMYKNVFRSLNKINNN